MNQGHDLAEQLQQLCSNLDTTDPDPTDLYRLAVGVLKRSQDKVLADYQKQRNPLGTARPPHKHHPYLTFGGLQIPRAALEWHRLRNSLRRKLARLLEKESNPPTIEQVTQLRTEISALQQRWKRALREATAMHDRALAEKAERLRKKDPSKLFAALQQELPEDPDLGLSTTTVPREAEGPLLVHFPQLLREDRDPPVGPTHQSWLQHVPVALHPTTSEMLASPITDGEVLVAIYPLTRADNLPPCIPGCALCALAARQQAAWRAARGHDAFNHCPNPFPHAATRRAAGVDGLLAETLRWRRGRTLAATRAERLAVSTSLARLLNFYWMNTRIPGCPEFLESTLSPVFKKGDKRNPDHYRGIAVGNLLPKILTLVLYRRLYHWAVHNGLIPVNQAGFNQYHGCEHNIFMLLESVKAKWRAKSDAYILFVDFRKAYDSVHLESLWAILTRMGVPYRFVEYLRQWDNTRTMRVRVNNSAGNTFQQSKGLPQGDVLSTLLFNLYIASLTTYLSTLPQLQGITITSGPYSATVKDIYYADDLACMGSSRQELQIALQHIYLWGRAWGIDLNTGKGKTEAMVLPRDSSQREHLASTSPPLHLDPTGVHTNATVGWTTSYTFLGLLVQSNLDFTEAFTQIKRKLTTTIHRLFCGNYLVREFSPALQLQLTGTLILGAATHVLSTLPLQDSQVKQLDQSLSEAARSIMSAARTFPTSYVWAETRMRSFHGMIQQHRFRLRQSLLTHPMGHYPRFPGQDVVTVPPERFPLAVRVMAAIEHLSATRYPSDAALPSNMSNSLDWATHTRMMKRKLITDVNLAAAIDNAMHNERIPYWRIPEVAAIIGTHASFAHWCSEATKGKTPPVHLIPRPSPSEHSIDIHLLHTLRLWNVIGYGFEHRAKIPLSMRGPDCPGSLVALSTKPSANHTAIYHFRTGQLALTLYPFNGRRQGPAQRRGLGDVSSVHDHGPCKLCHGEAGQPAHLLHNCLHPTMVTIRVDLDQDMHEFMERFATHLVRYHKNAQSSANKGWLPAATREIQNAANTLRHELQTLRTNNGETNLWRAFLRYRVVGGLPYPEQSVQAAHVPLGTPTDPTPLPSPPYIRAWARLLGSVRLPRHMLRSLADSWLKWSGKWIHRIASSYISAVNAQ